MTRELKPLTDEELALAEIPEHDTRLVRRLAAEVRRLRTENERLREPDRYVEVTVPSDKERQFIKARR